MKTRMKMEIEKDLECQPKKDKIVEKGDERIKGKKRKSRKE